MWWRKIYATLCCFFVLTFVFFSSSHRHFCVFSSLKHQKNDYKVIKNGKQAREKMYKFWNCCEFNEWFNLQFPQLSISILNLSDTTNEMMKCEEKIVGGKRAETEGKIYDSSPIIHPFSQSREETRVIKTWKHDVIKVTSHIKHQSESFPMKIIWYLNVSCWRTSTSCCWMSVYTMSINFIS